MNRTAKQKFIALATTIIIAAVLLQFNCNASTVFAAETNGRDDTASVQVLCLEFDGASLYAGTLDNGLFKSADHGASWTSAGIGIEAASIRGIYHDGNALYAYTYEGIYKSVNGAESWTSANDGLVSKIVSAMISDGSALFAATPEGIYKSADNGETWAFSNSGLEMMITTAFAVDGTTIYAGTQYNGIYKSVNGGANWHNINNGIEKDLSVSSMDCFDGALYVGTHLGICKTDDGGISWEILNADWANPKVSALYFDGTELYAGTLNGDVYQSTDGGKTWSAVYSFAESSGVRAFLSDGTALYTATKSGVYKSADNGISWTGADSGIVKTNTEQEKTETTANLSAYKPIRIGRMIASIVLTIVILSLGGAALFLIWNKYQEYKLEQQQLDQNTETNQVNDNTAKLEMTKTKSPEENDKKGKSEAKSDEPKKSAAVKEKKQAENNNAAPQNAKSAPKLPKKDKTKEEKQKE